MAATIVADLRRKGTKKVRDGMARFAIPSDKAGTEEHYRMLGNSIDGTGFNALLGYEFVR